MVVVERRSWRIGLMRAMERCVEVRGAPVQPGEGRSPVDCPIDGGWDRELCGTFIVLLEGPHASVSNKECLGVASKEWEGPETK